MTRWILVLIVWYALLLAGFLALRGGGSSEDSPRSQVDWEMAAVCVWERWDAIQYQTFEETARIIRFCVEVEPHSLPPSQSPMSRG